MSIAFQERPSDSPFIERVWHGDSDGSGPFLSVAAGHLELIMTRLADLTVVTLRGPETHATTLDCPPDGQWSAIRFRLGVHLPWLPTHLLLDHRDLNLQVGQDGTFVIAGVRCDVRDFDDAEVFAARLATRNIIAKDPVVEAALRDDPQALTTRTIQRHFKRTTGLTFALYRQIERARHATNLLRDGVPILDAVHDAGYFDQAHLTRSLRTFIGQTPTSVARHERQLSFLYKTGSSGFR
jgi:Helix-turn-helix domain